MGREGCHSRLLQLLVAYAAAAAAAAAASYTDITVPVSAGLPVFMSAHGLPKNWRSQHQLIEEGDVCNQSSFVFDGEVALASQHSAPSQQPDADTLSHCAGGCASPA